MSNNEDSFNISVEFLAWNDGAKPALEVGEPMLGAGIYTGPVIKDSWAGRTRHQATIKVDSGTSGSKVTIGPCATRLEAVAKAQAEAQKLLADHFGYVLDALTAEPGKSAQSTTHTTDSKETLQKMIDEGNERVKQEIYNALQRCFR